MSILSRIFRRAPVEPVPPAKIGRPEQEPYFQPPGQWTMAAVDGALDAMERGEFREAGRLAFAVRCDEEVAALADLRTGTTTGLPFEFEPEFPGLRADWEYMFPVAAQDDVLYNCLMMGFALCQDVRTSHQELPCWQPWPLEATRFDTWRNCWQVETSRGMVDIQPGDGRWALFESRFARPWLAGYLRAIGPLMIIRQSTLFNWANHAQVYATPSRVLSAPARESEIEDVQRAIARLKKLVGDSTIVLPAGLRLELLELKELTYQIYERLRKAIDEALQIMLVGQLGTAKAAGGWGSAHTERRVTQQLLERDVRILQPTAHRQMMAPYDAWRRGTRTLAQVPRPIWDCTPPADKAAEATRNLQESQARYNQAIELKTLSQLDFGDGWRVDMVQVCKDRQIPLRQMEAA